MTHDELIAAGVWSGEPLAMRKRMAEYLVDSERLGQMEISTKSGSPNDIYMEKRVSEIVTAAMFLSRIGYEHAEISSFDANGKRLERPDLDVRLPDDQLIGVEVAEVLETHIGKHNAETNAVEVIVRDLLDNDAQFAAAFGRYYFNMTLNGIGPYPRAEIGSKKEAQAIASEAVRLIRAGYHKSEPLEDEGYFRDIPKEYVTLHARGTQFHASEMDSGPHFSLSEGASTFGLPDHRGEVLRVLGKHCRSAITYRPGTTWLFLFLTDWKEYFRNTVGAIADLKPAIAPFERVYMLDSASRLQVLSPDPLLT